MPLSYISPSKLLSHYCILTSKLPDCATVLNYKIIFKPTLMEHQETLFSVVKFAHLQQYYSMTF